MFQFSKEELANWRSQIVTSNPGAKKGLRYTPYAFTEQGVAMQSHERQIGVLFDHVQKLLDPAPVKKRPIGFIRPKD